METHLFWGQNVQVQGHENIAGVGLDTLAIASFFYV